MLPKLIEAERSVSVALNFESMDRLREVVSATYDVPGVESYTIGGAIGLRGLEKARTIIERCDPRKKAIYNHQILGTSDAAVAEPMLRSVADSGADAVVLFPIQNLQSQGQWIDAALAEELEVVVGPELAPLHGTVVHDRGQNPVTGQGFIRMFVRQALRKGIENFWLRGNNTHRVYAYQELLTEEGGAEATLFLAKVADVPSGKLVAYAHLQNPAVGVIGSAICDAGDVRKAALQLSESFIAG